MTEDEMVGWHHRLNGQEFEQALGDSEGQASLACCSPWGRKELNMTERPNTYTYTRICVYIQYIHRHTYTYICEKIQKIFT